MNSELIEKIKAIKLLILDVDGVLTNGQIYFLPSGEQYKTFYIQDGYGIEQLQKNGVTVAIISGKSSPAVTFRAKELGIKHFYQTCNDKVAAFNELIHTLDIQTKEVAFMGDDCPDLALMKKVGLRIAVNNAVDEIKAIADWKTEKSGGSGAVREVCDAMIKIQQQFPPGN